MQKLTEKRINELIELTEKKIIIRYREHKSVPNLDDYKHLIDSIKNINTATEKEMINEIKYYSCSSNFWEGVIPLLHGYEERLNRV